MKSRFRMFTECLPFFLFIVQLWIQSMHFVCVFGWFLFIEYNRRRRCNPITSCNECLEEIKFMSNLKIYGVMYFMLIFNKMKFHLKSYVMICSIRMVKVLLIFIFEWSVMHLRLFTYYYYYFHTSKPIRTNAFELNTYMIYQLSSSQI